MIQVYKATLLNHINFIKAKFGFSNCASYLVDLKPCVKSVNKFFAGTTKARLQIWDLLTGALFGYCDPPIPIKESSDKSGLKFFGYVGPLNSKTFSLMKSNPPKKISYRFGCKNNSEVPSPILCGYTVPHTDKGFHHFNEVVIFGAYFNGVALEIPIGPYQTNKPSKIVRPLRKETLVKGALLLRFSSFRPAAVNRSEAGGFLAYALSAPIAFFCAIFSIFWGFKRGEAIGTSASIHERIIPSFQTCHNSHNTRRAQIVERGQGVLI